jgi:hypothetical protein
MPATIETIKSTIIPITKIFLAEDFIRYSFSSGHLPRHTPRLNLDFMIQNMAK